MGAEITEVNIFIQNVFSVIFFVVVLVIILKHMDTKMKIKEKYILDFCDD